MPQSAKFANEVMIEFFFALTSVAVNGSAIEIATVYMLSGLITHDPLDSVYAGLHSNVHALLNPPSVVQTAFEGSPVQVAQLPG